MFNLKGQNTKHNLKGFYINCAKLYTIDFFFWTSMVSNKDDLCYQPMSHPDWAKILEKYETVSVGKD